MAGVHLRSLTKASYADHTKLDRDWVIVWRARVEERGLQACSGTVDRDRLILCRAGVGDARRWRFAGRVENGAFGRIACARLIANRHNVCDRELRGRQRASEDRRRSQEAEILGRSANSWQ